MDEKMKEFDWMLESINNPSFTNSDFKSVGINMNNTSLLSKEDYKNSTVIKENPVFQTEGEFDEVKFDNIYNHVLSNYNELSNDTYNEDVMSSAMFSSDNMFVAPEQRLKEPQLDIVNIQNPYKQTHGLIDIDSWSEQTKSEMEIAEGNKVLANPVAVENGADPIWEDAPEESFFDNF